MKTKYAILMMSMGISAVVMAQENDDMYFNSKDRVVANKVNASLMMKKYQQEDLNAVRSNPVNPSDSYTGRGVNPEYNAQVKNGTSVIQNNPDYFLSGYQPKNVNGSLYSGNNGYTSSFYGNSGCNSCYNNRMGYGGMGYSGMGYGGMGMGYGGFGSPFGYYSPYSSMMMGYGFGGYGSGFYGGMGYGMGSMFGSPFYSPFGMNSFYSPYYGYGYGGYGGSGYPYGTTVVINNGDSRGTTNARHPSRSDGLNNYVDNSRNDATINGTNGRVREGGRTRTESQTDYYDRGWRNNASNFPSRSYYDDNSGNSRSGYSNGGNNNSSWGDQGGRTRSSWDPSGSGSRSSFGGGGFSGGSGGNTGSGGSSGGGGGGHSRGRN